MKNTETKYRQQKQIFWRIFQFATDNQTEREREN